MLRVREEDERAESKGERRTVSEEMGYQVLESIEADFEEMTWTFSIGSGNQVAGGRYAVLPTDEFSKLTRKLAHAEGLLRPLVGSFNALTDEQRERIEKFFDPEPL